ncbi:MAG: ATP-binding protein [Holophagae bacterium]|nr:ATP-binding protein [Holophagae bacterium]
MALVMGPRQVGKTTSARTLDEGHAYLNWDNVNDRRLVLAGPDELANSCGLNQLRRGRRTVVLDEIHKYSKWKGFLKGLFDSYGDRGAFVVTGSARMDMYRRGGDSLMGRYFAYRMHPLSVGELLRPVFRKTPILEPRRFSANDIDQLLRFGGFPEPFLKADTRFYNRWRRLRSDQLFREDFRDMTRIHEIKQLEVLAELVLDRAGQLMNYSNLAAAVNCSVDTIRRWLGAFENLYYCFQVKPWHRNVTKSLRKQPKAYLWDWSQVADHGQRTENFVASHLLKACHFWTDAGFGTYELFFLRDKTKREVDFLVTEDGKPWFLVEVKSSGSGRISSNLSYFQSQIGARHAFQLELSAPYVDKDCFQESHPIRVPASTLLSQLV